MVVPLSVTRNPYGVVVDVVELGKPKRVEEAKRIQQAIFVAVEDGEINEGDLIGVANVYYVGVKKLEPIIADKKEQSFTMVYRREGKVVREKVTLPPSDTAEARLQGGRLLLRQRTWSWRKTGQLGLKLRK